MIALALLLLTAVAANAAPGASRLIASFETEAEVAKIATRNVTVSQTRDGATDGKSALRIDFNKADWPNAFFAAGDTPWDWRGFGALALDVTNPGTEEVSFSVRVDDDVTADGNKHCRQVGGTIAPGARGTYVVSLMSVDPMSVGMRGLPSAGSDGHVMSGRGHVDLSHIVAFQVFLPRPSAPRTLLVDNIRLVPGEAKVNLNGIVDAFGQYSGADWPGKLKAEAEFAQRRAAEEAELRARPALPGRDSYGGWAEGPTLKATGFFRAEQWNGKWWLVTPSGRLFFSIGMDCVRVGSSTFVEKREHMFAALPAAGDPLAKYYGRVSGVHSGPVKSGRTYDFSNANLHRKYGPDFFAAWRETTHNRLHSWGFNTIANWSDPKVWEPKRVPYVATYGIGGEHKRVATGSDYWGKMHDPFDPQFVVDAENAVRRAADIKDDPWCVGAFVDNELSWGGGGIEGGRYGLALGSLAAEAGSPAKAEFVARLKAKYDTIERLNAAWATQIASWETLAGQPWKPTGDVNATMKADLADFVKHFARRYFTVVRDALKKYDPNHLYMGCRFAWSTPEAVAASAEVCDVVSFNIYRRRVEPKDWAHTNNLGKPCIIGEFHFGALDRGMFHTGLVSTGSQKERADAYKEYVRSVADHPAFVGCHWFQYKDEPLTGRTLDGENYNIGFVDVTDTPYPEMVAAAREVHAELYRRRAGK